MGLLLMGLLWANFLPFRSSLWGFPGGASGKESSYQYRWCSFHPWVQKMPWRRKWQPTPVFLPGESRGQRSLVGCSPWGRSGAPLGPWTHTSSLWGGMGIAVHGLVALLWGVDALMHVKSWEPANHESSGNVGDAVLMTTVAEGPDRAWEWCTFQLSWGLGALPFVPAFPPTSRGTWTVDLIQNTAKQTCPLLERNGGKSLCWCGETL